MYPELRIKEITEELSTSLKEENFYGRTGSNILLGWSHEINRSLFMGYKLARRFKLHSLQGKLLPIMKYFRKHVVNCQQGKLRINSKKAEVFINLVRQYYDRPIHICDMFDAFINNDIGLVKCLGFYRSTYVPQLGQSFGYIAIEESLSINQQAHTLIHELVHAKFQTLVSERQIKTNKPDPEFYSMNEVTAESVAYILSKYLCIEFDEYQSKSYIAGYLPEVKKLKSQEEMMKDAERIAIEVLSYLNLKEIHYSSAM